MASKRGVASTVALASVFMLAACGGGGGGAGSGSTSSSPPASIPCTANGGPGINGLSFTGTVGFSDLSGATSTNDPSITVTYGVQYTGGGTSGSIRTSLWAMTASYNGSQTLSGYQIATFNPEFTGGGAPVQGGNQLLNNSTSTVTDTSSGTTPPRGSYCMVLLLEEFDPGNCSAADGFCFTDWHQFGSSEEWSFLRQGH